MTNYEILKEYEEHKEPVPSYDEWKKLKSHDEIATIKLGEKYIENDKLKELLKECRNWLKSYSDTHSSIKDDVNETICKISEVLK